MDLSTWLIGLVTALFLYLLTRQDKSYPPGPLSLPILGNAIQLIKAGSLYKFLRCYRAKYGDVFSFAMAGKRTVIVSGYDAVRELLVKNADFSSNRPTSGLGRYMDWRVMLTPGVVYAPFPDWKILRTLAINTLRHEGMGKSFLEPKIFEEVEQYIEVFLKPNLGSPTNISSNLNQATLNIISQMIFNRRFEYDDTECQRIAVAATDVFILTSKVRKIESMPLGQFLSRSSSAQLKSTYEETLSRLMKYVEEAEQTFDTENPRNLIDRCLIQAKSASDEDKSTFSKDKIAMFFLHLYMAGTETTATALQWALIFMCQHPEVREKVQAEIDDVVGRSRSVECKDRLRMPYTDAVIFESLRKGNIAQVGLPHIADKDLIIDGVRIPRGTTVFPNLGSILSDEEVFEEPDKFKPERYLTGDIGLKKQRTIPFGIGRRVCPGESLAKMEFFIFFVTFLQRFDVSAPEGVTLPEESQPDDGIIRAPLSFKLVFTERT